MREWWQAVRRAREAYATDHLAEAAALQREANDLRAIGLGGTYACLGLELGVHVATLKAQIIGRSIVTQADLTRRP